MKAVGMAALLALTLLAGCLGGDDDPDETNRQQVLDSINLPDGATLEEAEDAIIARWSAANLPFTQSFELPEGATMVRFVADPGDSATVSIAMSHDDTGRRRCNQQSVLNLAENFRGPRSCSSIAAMDMPGTNWTARATGTGSIDARVEFYFTPLDGPAANVDWSLLSQATHDLQTTVGQYITAHDGTQLWTEITIPEGEGPWPTVIAASPYNGQAGRLPDPGEGNQEGTGTPAMWTYWTQDYAKRGYAAVNIDVRGFGKSGGCVEVWGTNEQLDQKLIVDWVADQAWSDGNVGFYGQSYVATTPVAAAVQAPEALKAIIAVAPVIDSYHDWHFGGVPNGESSLSPVAYQALVDMAGSNYLLEELEGGDVMPTDLLTLAQYATQGFCDPSLIPLANDPRAIHGPFYDDRDFGARAGDINAAVLFTQGFEDANVKSAMIPDWFNAIEAPKLGVFGHWLHQHPARMDAEALFLGWMDEFVKGKPLGLAEAYPDAIITADETHMRADNAWPPEVEATVWGFDFAEETMAPGAGTGNFQLDLSPLAAANTLGSQAGPIGNDLIMLHTEPVTAATPIVAPTVQISGTLMGENAFLHAELVEVRSDGTVRLLTWGMKNIALGDDYDTYTPNTPGQAITDVIPLRETEHVLSPGSIMVLTLRGVQAGEAVGTAQPQPGLFTIEGDGSALLLPMVSIDEYEPMALTALP